MDVLIRAHTAQDGTAAAEAAHCACAWATAKSPNAAMLMKVFMMLILIEVGYAVHEWLAVRIFYDPNSKEGEDL